MTRKVPSVPSSQSKGGLSWIAGVWLGTLLILPLWAVTRLGPWIDGRIVAGTWGLVSAITYFLYRADKRRAEAGEWRIPESTLHFAELVGGWPGAFLAQRVYRHKTAKLSYQVVFWLIVFAHQFAAGDSLAQWKYSTDFLRWMKTLIS